MKTITLKNIKIKEIIISPDEHMVITYSLLNEDDVPVYMKQVVVKTIDFPQTEKLERFIEQLLVNIKATEGVL